MKRDWELIRDVLIEVEALDSTKFEEIHYECSCSEAPLKAAHAVLLWREGFIRGADTSSADGDGIIAQELEWKGHDLLDTIRSQAVWERIKKLGKDKGIELTFESVKALGAAALAYVMA